MYRVVALLCLLAGTATAEPAWVTANRCSRAPSLAPLCDPDEPALPTDAADLASCGCALGGTSSCTAATSSFRIDAPLATTIRSVTAAARGSGKAASFVIPAHPDLARAAGGLAALRLARVEVPKFPAKRCASEADALALFRSVLSVSPIAEALVDTGERISCDRAELLLLDGMKRATAIKNRLRAGLRACTSLRQATDAARAQTGLACLMTATQPAAHLLQRWPYCQCDGPHSYALPYGNDGWMCLESAARVPELHFGELPIAREVVERLAELAQIIADGDPPYRISRIRIGACFVSRLETGGTVQSLRAGDSFSLHHVSAHARGTACDIQAIELSDGAGGTVEIAFTDGKERPFVKALRAFVEKEFAESWESFRSRAASIGLSRFYRVLDERLTGQSGLPPVLVQGVEMRVLLEYVGFVVYDPLVNASHDTHLHIELADGAESWRDEVIAHALHVAGGTKQQRAPVLRPDLQDEGKTEYWKSVVRLTSTTLPRAKLERVFGDPVCSSTPRADLEMIFAVPVRVRGVRFDGNVRLEVSADGGAPWRPRANGSGYETPVVDVSRIHIEATSIDGTPACLRVDPDFVIDPADPKGKPELGFAEDDKHFPELAGLLSRLPALRTCDEAGLAALVQFPATLAFDVDGRTSRQVFRSPRELMRACLLRLLPDATGAFTVARDAGTITYLATSPLWWLETTVAYTRGAWRVTGWRATDRISGRKPR